MQQEMQQRWLEVGQFLQFLVLVMLVNDHPNFCGVQINLLHGGQVLCLQVLLPPQDSSVHSWEVNVI